ncbi:CHAT domain-containing tetratricopeptide repeat protein [Actinoplanes sp. NPDC048796]|uniref:CHAT domain-containing protein n=1 Tax=Actinoplanes sp. NPDC048796 TaxID=3155640 RepID=UPI00340428F1
MSATEELIERLLLVDRITELPAVLRQELTVGGDELRATVERLAAERAAAGRTAEAEFLRFLAPLLDEALPEWARHRSGDPVAAALDLDDPLALLRLYRAEEALRTPEALNRARELVAASRLPSRQRERSALLYAVLGLHCDRREVRVQSRATWAATLRRRGDLPRALFHSRRAEREADDQQRVLLQGLTAGIQGLAGDLTGRIATLTDALDGAEGLTREPLHRGLAEDLRELGRTREALDHVNAALALLGDDPMLDEFRFGLVNLRGLLHEDVGEYEYGSAAYEEAIAIAVRMGDRGHEFDARTNAAASLLKAGRVRAGRRAFERVHQLVTRWGVPNLIPAASNNLAEADMQAGDLDAAAGHFGAVLAMRPADEASRGVAHSLFGLGDVLRRRGDLASAATMYRMALVTGIRAGDAEQTAMLFAGRIADVDDPETEGVLRELAENHRGSSRWRVRHATASALADYLARHDRVEAAVEATRELLAEAQRLGDARAVAEVRQSLARLLARDPRGRAEAFRLLWSVRADVLSWVDAAGDPARRAEIVSEFISLYEQLLDLLLDGGTGLPLPDRRPAAELAFDLHEEAKSRTLLAELAELPTPVPASVPSDLSEREADLRARRRTLLTSLPLLTGDGRRRRLDELAELTGRLDGVYREVAAYAPDYARHRQGRPVTLAVVRDLLDRHAPAEGMLLVSYFCGRETTTYFAVEPGGALHSFRVPLGAEAVTAVVDRLRATFNGNARAFPPVAPIHPRRPHRRELDFLAALGEPLLRFTGLLAGRPLLCAVPHGPLHLTPLHALPDSSGAPLAARVAVTYAPSLSLLAHTLSRPVIHPESVLVAAVAAREDPDPLVFEEDAGILRAAGWPVTVLAGPAATPKATLAALGRHEIAHVTCHGYVDDASPGESGLVLSDGDRPTKYVGRLSISQRRATVLRAEDLAVALTSVRLLTLRACSSAWQSGDHRGDEFTGLNRALLRGGAAATLASLWNVDQHSSAEFLGWVYAGWRAGEPLWRALGEAQRRALADPRTWMRHPYHWAPLALTGDWR